MTSPVTNSSRLLKKINIMTSRPPRAFRVAILGQNGVGKTAFSVRFITKRYIGEYDPLLERIYTCQRTIMDSTVDIEIWDTAGINENSKLKEHIRWADAIILMYAVTDRCSFNECSRLKFLVNAYARSSRRRKTGSDPSSELTIAMPVVLVGNKKDKDQDRMVSAEEGAERCRQLGCVSFQEISVQEDVDEVTDVIEELHQTYRKIRKSRPSLTGSLTASKSSLFGGDSSSGRLQGSSSDEDNGNNSKSNDRDGDSSSSNNSLTVVSGGRGRGRRVTLSNTSMDIPDEEWIRKARSRRREAFYTIN
ncbi:ras-related and estrogen-regulated growth inhibitor [Plakobranchus ocellatus]|uniref:small monomeric GTPase n=1 Tax=Plakobranchus ocellatus TaxID=259542 RepID=A0AAV3ZEE3_9GAST|nr:ras-related and estrogen-regulated growth inhibitor [Plakobranchus ocellatus]